MDKIFKGHDIITYDDILTTKETNYFEQLFFYSNRFPWYQRKQSYTVSTAHGNYFKDNEAINDGPMMVHEFWNNGFDIHSAKGDDKRKSEHYRLADMLMQKVCAYFKIEGIDGPFDKSKDIQKVKIVAQNGRKLSIGTWDDRLYSLFGMRFLRGGKDYDYTWKVFIDVGSAVGEQDEFTPRKPYKCVE